MADYCHAPLFVNICISRLCAALIRVCIFPAYRTLILGCCFSPFGRLMDKPEIDDDIFFRPFARLRWLEEGVV